jgi:hypothetical protein
MISLGHLMPTDKNRPATPLPGQPRCLPLPSPPRGEGKGGAPPRAHIGVTCPPHRPTLTLPAGRGGKWEGCTPKARSDAP